MYAGLTTADKGALLDARANGFKVFCETSNGNRVFYSKYPSASEANSRIVSIDLALAQIAEMESKTEMIFGYPIEHLQKIAAIMHHAHITPEDVKKCADNFTLCVELTMTALKESMDKSMTEHIANLQAFYSPYTEGATK